MQASEKRIVSLARSLHASPTSRGKASHQFEKTKMRDVTPLQRIFDAQLKSHAARGPFCPWECAAAVLDLCELASIQRVCVCVFVLCSCCALQHYIFAIEKIYWASSNPAWWDYRTSPDAHTPPHFCAFSFRDRRRLSGPNKCAMCE